MAKKNSPVVTPPSVDGLMETKLTKSEVIGLIIEDMEKNLNEQLRLVQDEIKNFSNKLPIEKLNKFVTERSRLKNFHFSSYKNDNFAAHLTWDSVGFQLADLPSWMLPFYHEHAELIKKQTSLNELINGLREREKAKNYILRQALATTDDGRDLLEMIKSFGVVLQGNLLTSGTPVNGK